MTTPLIVVVANPKGGVAKTTTAAMILRHLAPAHRVLGIDMDPRASLTELFGVISNSRNTGHVLGGANAPSATLRTAARVGAHDIDIIPANMDLANVAHGLHNRMFDRFTALAAAIRNTGNDWDVIVIDSPATADVLTINALAVANRLVIPSQPEDHSINAITETRRLMHQIYRATDRTDGWTEHLVATMVDDRTIGHQRGLERIARLHGDPDRLITIPVRKGQDADAQLFDAYRPLAQEIAPC